MLELGVTLTWSIVKKKKTFQLNGTAWVFEGSSDLCDDTFVLYWDGREQNVRNRYTKLGGVTLSIHLTSRRVEIRH